MIRRTGTTLSEVLIAIFVLAIGLMGVLSLFPLGAMSMAQAIKDDRCAQVNKDANALAHLGWEDIVSEIPGSPPYIWPPSNFPNPDPLVNAMIDPNYSPFPPTPLVAPHPAMANNVPVLYPNPSYSSTLPSYPVFVDMVGWNNSSIITRPHRYWVGGQVGNSATNQPPSIPRRTLRRAEYLRVNNNPPIFADWNAIGSPPLPPGVTGAQVKAGLMHRYFYQTDDLSWGADGTLVDSNGNTAAALGTHLAGTVQRDGRYSWAFLLRRPKVNLPLQAELTIVAYTNRSVNTPLDENDQWIEQPYPNARFYPNTNEAEIVYTGARPKIRKNSWILDATMVNNFNRPEPHGYFYRVIEVNDETPGVLSLTLQQHVRAGTIVSFTPPQGYGLAVVMEHVAEVFERNKLTDTTMPVP
jgi:hypothetical protein